MIFIIQKLLFIIGRAKETGMLNIKRDFESWLCVFKYPLQRVRYSLDTLGSTINMFDSFWIYSAFKQCSTV